MKKNLFLILLLSVGAYAQNLQEILNSLEESNKINLIKQTRDSEIASNKLLFSHTAPELGLSATHAKDSAQEGAEYSVSLTQNIAQPFAQNSKNSATEFATKSLQQGAIHDMHMIKLNIVSKYHSACMAKEIKDKANLLLQEQEKRYTQIQKAYDLGEISKKELFFNKLDLAKLSQKVSSYKRVYIEELSALQKDVDNLAVEQISCNDLLQPTRHVQMKDVSEHDEIIDLEFQQQSSKALYDVFNSDITALGYNLSYDKELQMKKYTAGVTIPLSFMSEQKEQEKAKYLHRASAINAQKSVITKEIQTVSASLRIKVETLYDEYTLLLSEIVPLSEDLVQLSKSAHEAGEGAIMEYLDATRSYKENMLEMLEIKKTYYYELFELYKKADLEFGENHVQ